MYIVLLTSVYPSMHSPKGTTPVVHYFAKEWVKNGHKVQVFHNVSFFPKFFYFCGKIIKKIMDSRLGHIVPEMVPEEYFAVEDGVHVSHVLLRKTIPHGRFSAKQIQKVYNIVSAYIEKEGVPDCIVGHWDNPQLELLHLLKAKYHRPTCLVYHSNRFEQLYKCYGELTDTLVKDVDLVGFRNITARSNYEKLFGKPIHSFIAASGVSTLFLEAGRCYNKEIKDIKRFLYVGALIQRKHPVEVVEALSQSYGNEAFEITYIGEGNERCVVQQRYDELGCAGKLMFTGRIPREDIIKYLKESDVFVMISSGEIFGLVYLEAMALGCITIASRHEGIDGIIEDGVNGFLCEAGNTIELASIVSKIRNMSLGELNAISKRAIETAQAYSDVNVAKKYIDNLSKIVL